MSEALESHWPNDLTQQKAAFCVPMSTCSAASPWPFLCMCCENACLESAEGMQRICWPGNFVLKGGLYQFPKEMKLIKRELRVGPSSASLPGVWLNGVFPRQGQPACRVIKFIGCKWLRMGGESQMENLTACSFSARKHLRTPPSQILGLQKKGCLVIWNFPLSLLSWQRLSN